MTFDLFAPAKDESIPVVYWWITRIKIHIKLRHIKRISCIIAIVLDRLTQLEILCRIVHYLSLILIVSSIT